MEHRSAPNPDEGNGIYMFNDSEKVSYLYLTQDFFKSGKDFGGLDVKIADDSLNIYLTEDSDVKGLVDKY